MARRPRKTGRAGVLVFAALGAASALACRSSRELPVLEGLDRFLDSVAVADGIPGYSFAAFDDRGVLYERVGGVKDRNTGEPVDAETVFEAASISKPVFAYIVLSLVRAGVMDLDAPIGQTTPVGRELGYDSRAAELTGRLLLSHQGGLPNWRTRLNFNATSYEELFGPADTLRFVADPGTGYRYSGEGYVLLQEAVEQARHRSLEELAEELVFKPLGMTRSSFRFDARARTDWSMGHGRDSTPDKWEIGLVLASSTLHTTASDLATFGAHLAAVIQPGQPYAAMAEPAVTVAARDGWEASWGLGLGIVSDGSRTYVYHGGNNVIFIADFIYGYTENLGYVLMTNSALGQAMVQAVERRVYGRDIPGR